MSYTELIAREKARRGVTAGGGCDPIPPPDVPADATPDQLERAANCYVTYLECCATCPASAPECCQGCLIQFWECWGLVFPGSASGGDHGDPGDCSCSSGT